MYKYIRTVPIKVHTGCLECHNLDAIFWLTVGSFLVTVELFYLQLCLGALSLATGVLCLELKLFY